MQPLNRSSNNRFIQFDAMIGRMFVLGASIVLSWLSAMSFLYTVIFPPDGTEVPAYTLTFGVPALFLALGWLGLFVLIEKMIGLDNINSQGLLCAVMGYALVVGLVWVLAVDAPVQSDQSFLMRVAQEFLSGEYGAFRPGAYMCQYPHQIGMVSWLALLQVLFGTSVFVPQIVNALLCPLIFFLLFRITHQIFHNKAAQNAVLLLSFGCLPIILYSTFVYGTVLSLLLCLAAVNLQYKAMETGRCRWFVLAGVCITLAVQIKPNSMVFLVGMVLVLLLQALQEKKLRTALFALLMVAMMMATSEAAVRSMEQITGYDLQKAQPKTAHIAMGLQEGPLAPGWFNQYNDLVYITNDFEPTLIHAQATEDIKAALLHFVRDPAYAAWFFHTKTISQWSEPTFGCFWVSFDVHHDEPAWVTQLYVGWPQKLLVQLLDGFQLLIFSAAAFAIWHRRKTLKTAQLMLAIIMLGGFLFHMFWEAKGQYTLLYFMALLPYAATGLSDGAQKLAHRKKTQRTQKIVL